MWEWISSWGHWDEVGTGLYWLVTVGLLIIGLAGCVVPVIPGHLIILLAAVGHWLVLGDASGIAWWSFLIMVVLMAASQAFEFFSGAAGARWFGGTKWGAGGAMVGGIVGMFFMPFGLLLGPLIGAYAFEALFAKQETKPAVVSGVGSAVGTVAGIVVKIIVGILMVAWFLIDVWWLG